MHLVSQRWCGEQDRTGFILPPCFMAAAGAKQDAACGEVNPQDILDYQKQEMFSFTSALLPMERTE